MTIQTLTAFAWENLYWRMFFFHIRNYHKDFLWSRLLLKQATQLIRFIKDWNLLQSVCAIGVLTPSIKRIKRVHGAILNERHRAKNFFFEIGIAYKQFLLHRLRCCGGRALMENFLRHAILCLLISAVFAENRKNRPKWPENQKNKTEIPSTPDSSPSFFAWL